jgi:hypothetical protein
VIRLLTIANPQRVVFRIQQHAQLSWCFVLLLQGIKQQTIAAVTHGFVPFVHINQLDLQERSKQVQKMTDIYQTASKSLTWLGEATQDSYLAMNIIDDIIIISLDNVPFSIEDEHYQIQSQC